MLKNLRKRFDIFCFRNRNKGIPNLMLYLSLGSALVWLFSEVTGNYLLYYWLCFDRDLILQGQLWRLISYPLTYTGGSLILTAITLLCYYSLGRAIENIWGTLRFNLFYLSGVVLMDLFCLVIGGNADVYYLNLSLFLTYATMYPDAHFLLFFIIPVKAWIFAILDLVLTLLPVLDFSYFPHNLFPLVALANYFLFVGKGIVNVFPISWRANARRLFKKKPRQAKVVPFPTAGSYEATTARPKDLYTHRCTVCGRTDVSDPQLEFRYCSKCKGYYCYCEEHISNHIHVE